MQCMIVIFIEYIQKPGFHNNIMEKNMITMIAVKSPVVIVIMGITAAVCMKQNQVSELFQSKFCDD